MKSNHAFIIKRRLNESSQKRLLRVSLYFEDGYCEVRGWWDNASDVFLLVLILATCLVIAEQTGNDTYTV